jgi:hypothetical protein
MKIRANARGAQLTLVKAERSRCKSVQRAICFVSGVDTGKNKLSVQRAQQAVGGVGDFCSAEERKSSVGAL